MADIEGVWGRYQNSGAPSYGWDAFAKSPYHTARTRAGYISGTVHPYRRGAGPSPRIARLQREPRLPREPPKTRRLQQSGVEVRKMGYFERRFGWASNFKIMWDTDPSGSVSGIERVEPCDRGGSARRVVQSVVSSGWDRDPAQLQLVPAAGTCGTALRPHECWDNRGSSSWRGTIAKEAQGQLAAIPRPAATAGSESSFKPSPPSLPTPPATAPPKVNRFMVKPTKVLGLGGHFVHAS